MENQNSIIQKDPSLEIGKGNTTNNPQTNTNRVVLSHNSVSSDGNSSFIFRYGNTIKALLFIAIPLILFAVVQSGPLWVAVMLMSPVLAIFLLYGIYILFRGGKSSSGLLKSNTFTTESLGKKSYTKGVVLLVIGLLLSAIAAYLIFSIRASAGYSGSEGEIASFPFIVSAAVFLLFSLINLALTFFANLTTKSRE